jgi:hypothetical protein
MFGRSLLAVVILALITGCVTMQNRWEKTKSADNIHAYEDFLKEYPEGDLASQAKARLNELHEQMEWRDAEAKDTISAYEDFIGKYPHGKYGNDAHARMEELYLEEAKSSKRIEKFLNHYKRGVFFHDAWAAIEKLDFEKVAEEDTVSAYDEFLKRYPRGIFADQARSMRKKLIENKIFEWGILLYPRSNINIRTKRSVASKRKGQLKAGQPVKADFLQDGWYAVFQVTEKQRDETLALGYVYAPLLADPLGSQSYESAANKKESVMDGDAPLKKIETENPSVEVKRITFKIAEDGKELLFIEFNRFCTPAISGIEGKEPRIVLDIAHISSFRKDWAVINTGGKMIRRIRSSMNTKTRMARIVLDMNPSKGYYVHPVFYEKDNVYSLEISEEKEKQVP